MVRHVQPVADLLAVAIHRQRLAGQCVDDHQRDQLLGEVVGPVVVAAVGGEHRQAVGVVVGTNQMVARRLAGRVRAVGLVAVGFGECGVVFCEGAVNFVSGYVKKAEAGFGRAL